MHVTSGWTISRNSIGPSVLPMRSSQTRVKKPTKVDPLRLRSDFEFCESDREVTVV